MAREIVYITYAPYLPLGERATVGGWELIPRAEFRDDDALDAHVAELARGFADLHQLPAGAGRGVGAFAHFPSGAVGESPEDNANVIDLRRALVVAVLDGNESPVLPEEEQDANAAHRMLTSDNAGVDVGGIDREGGYTATYTGGRVRWLNGGIPVLPADRMPGDSLIAPPADLHVPTLPRILDYEYGSAAWESIRRGTDGARRLGRAIDWLYLAWRNTSAITDDLRIPALRAGFEVLLDSDQTSVLRDRFCALLDDADAPTSTRTSTHPRTGKVSTAEVSDLGWWFMRFAFLRNDLMHGRSPTNEAWRHDGKHHTDLGEWWLRQTIKETIARNGHEDVREDPLWREAFRGAFEYLSDHGDVQPESSEDEIDPPR